MLSKKQFLILGCTCAVVYLLFRYTVGKQFINQDGVPRVPGTPIVVGVFYEALCPDSKHFIMKQLLSAYKSAPSLLEVVLIPYGKASTTVNEDGSYRFDCQHGSLECEANIYHACAIDNIPDPLTRLELISCMIKDNRLPKEALLKCAQEHDVASVLNIQQCRDSDIGQRLLKLHGDSTNALRPRVTFIPTVTLDGSQGKQSAILKNLMSEICKIAAGDNLAKNVCTN